MQDKLSVVLCHLLSLLTSLIVKCFKCSTLGRFPLRPLKQRFQSASTILKKWREFFFWISKEQETRKQTCIKVINSWWMFFLPDQDRHGRIESTFRRLHKRSTSTWSTSTWSTNTYTKIGKIEVFVGAILATSMGLLSWHRTQKTRVSRNHCRWRKTSSPCFNW